MYTECTEYTFCNHFTIVNAMINWKFLFKTSSLKHEFLDFEKHVVNWVGWCRRNERFCFVVNLFAFVKWTPFQLFSATSFRQATSMEEVGARIRIERSSRLQFSATATTAEVRRRIELWCFRLPAHEFIKHNEKSLGFNLENGFKKNHNGNKVEEEINCSCWPKHMQEVTDWKHKEGWLTHFVMDTIVEETAERVDQEVEHRCSRFLRLNLLTKQDRHAFYA